jgi:transcription elongation factor Elf1
LKGIEMAETGTAATGNTTAEDQTLAPVGKSIYAECKKCGTERYLTVLAHKTATSAKVKCEVCGAQKTYTVPKSQTRKKTGVSTRGAKAASNLRDAHAKEYEKLMQENEKSPAETYNMKMKFEANQKLNHPKFGAGVIRVAQSDKIEVVFPDVVRSLVHNRQ